MKTIKISYVVKFKGEKESEMFSTIDFGMAIEYAKRVQKAFNLGRIEYVKRREYLF